jgi:Flp pilus assembly protein TadD
MSPSRPSHSRGRKLTNRVRRCAYRAQPNWEDQEAVKLDPSFADPYAGLGFLYVARGQLEAAARELRAAKELDFRLVPAREELGFVLFLLGKNEEASWEFREVLRVDPRLIRASSGLGMTLVRLGRLDEAQEG